MNAIIQVEDVASALAAGGRPAAAAQATMLQAAADTAAATAVSLCNGRDFARQTYTEQYWPTRDGLIFLRQMPVNLVSRISAGKSPAITIQAAAGPARASASFDAGALAGSPPVGVTLTSVSAGATTSTQILFASLADQSINSLGIAIGQVPGWSATVQPWAAGYPVTDLVGASVAAPALGPGADVAAYATDIPGRLDHRAGILRIPAVELAGAQQYADPSWWPEVGGVSDDRIGLGSVLVSYDAGFDAIPPNVVAGTVLIAIALLDRWTADFTLMSEDLGNTSYSRASPAMLGAIPEAARDFLLKYRISRV